MARTTLSYLQDDEDPLNQLLGGGGEPATPDAPPAAPSYDQTPPEPSRDNLSESLLAAPRPEAAQPSPQPTAAFAAPQPPQRDEELDNAYRNAQLDALQHAKFDDSKYGVAEGLRDNGAALIASILDIGFNKGRGLGGIVGATAQEVGRQAAARETQRKNAAEFALQARKQHDSASEQARLQYLYDSLAARKDAEAGRSTRFTTNVERQDDPKSPHNMTAVLLAGLKSAASTDARQDTEHDNAPRTSADAAAQAGAVTDAQVRTQLGYAPQQAEAGALKAGAESQARLPAEQQLKQTATPSEQRAAADEQLRQTPIPGLTVLNNPAYSAAVMSDRKGLEKYVQGVQTSTDALDQMIKLRQQLGPVWNTLDDQQKSIAQKQLSDLQKQAIGGATVVGNSGVLNGAEFGRYAADIPDGSFAATDLTDQLLGAATQTNRDTQLEKMIAARQAFQNAANAGLKSAGSRFGAPQAGDQLPVSNGAPPPVNQVVGYPRPTQGQNVQAGGGELHTLLKPDGTPVTSRQSIQDIQAAIADGRLKGWKVVQ